MGKAADLWRHFCLESRRYLRRDADFTFDNMADIINEIADCEYNAFSIVKNCFFNGI